MDNQELIAQLRATSGELARALERLPRSLVRESPSNGAFSMVENLWHMADLESMGYRTRIARILDEDRPVLPDFPGDRIARERNYKALDPADGLAAFTRARNENLARLATVTPAQWLRMGSQEEVGDVSLSDVARMMLEHDRSHLEEIAALELELTGNI